MAHFFHLQDCMESVAQQFFAMTQAASQNLQKEVEAVIMIQSFYRASKVKSVFKAVKSAVRHIQCICRGTLARRWVKSLKASRDRRLHNIFFHHCAATIQKVFRGGWSRKHLHDYYGRKRYLHKVEQRGEWTKEYLKNEHQAKLAQAKLEEEKKMREEFDALAGELHHLVSTKTIPGVYNPPYNDTLPRAFEKPIEMHLRDSCRVQLPRSLLRPRFRASVSQSPRHNNVAMGMTQAEQAAAMLASTGGPPQDLPERNPYNSRTASVGRMQKIQGPFRSKEQIEVASAKASNVYRSVQCSSSYDALEYDRKMQQRIAKLTRLSPIDFVAPGSLSEKMVPASVHVNVPYRDRPVEMRSAYTELPKIKDKPPFFTALPSDRQFEEYNEQHLLPCGHV